MIKRTEVLQPMTWPDDTLLEMIVDVFNWLINLSIQHGYMLHSFKKAVSMPCLQQSFLSTTALLSPMRFMSITEI